MHSRASAPASDGTPAVVLVHGLGVSSRYMVPLARTLASQGFEVHAVDLPGFGLSHRPDRALELAELAGALAAWLMAADLEGAALVANSFGCQVVVELLAGRPSLTGRVVLLAPTVDPRARSTIRQLGRWMLTVPWEKPSLAAVIARDYRDAGLRRVKRTANFAREDRIEEKLPHVEAPVLVVRGTRDSVVPQAWSEQAAGLAPHGRLELIEGAAHCLNFSAPAETANLVRSFLA